MNELGAMVPPNETFRPHRGQGLAFQGLAPADDVRLARDTISRREWISPLIRSPLGDGLRKPAIRLAPPRWPTSLARASTC